MSNSFPIFAVPSDAAEAEEAMGTKPKFWFEHPEFGECLFKQARSNTGEDWSEKIAAELAQLLGLPHAKQELANYREQPGTLSPLMIPEDGSLIHGNDILAGIVSNYPRNERYNVSEHTLHIVLQAVSNSAVSCPIDWEPPNEITTALDTFVGYLLLDAWIGNTDRHHENWGFVKTIRKTTHLSPTYDHASCLGRELLDANRAKRIQNNSVVAYTDRAKSAFFAQSGDKEPLLAIDAFIHAAQQSPQAASFWLQRLEFITSEVTQELLGRIPSTRISSVAIAFAQQVLDINKSKLIRLREMLP
jgi:hypothetical protein